MNPLNWEKSSILLSYLCLIIISFALYYSCSHTENTDSAHSISLHNLLCTQKYNDGQDRYCTLTQFKFQWRLIIIHIKIEECFENSRKEYIRVSNIKEHCSLRDQTRLEQVIFKLKWVRWKGVDEKGWYWWYLIWDIRKLENIPGKGSQSLDNRYGTCFC